MNPLWIPIAGTILGAAAVPAIVFFVMEQRLQEKRMQLEYESRRLDQEWEAARTRRKQ